MSKSAKITSGQPTEAEPRPDPREVVANVRRISGVPADRGLADAHIQAGVAKFVDQFEHWFERVIQRAVPNYRRLLIARINPFVRRIEFDGLTAVQVAERLVNDYVARNFVTAGGWAIEGMAVEASPTGRKSSANGIDIERSDAIAEATHLYVIKSGTVTRNSDILGALKRNVRDAEKRLLQGKQKGSAKVKAHYAIAAGKTTSSFVDGVNRPSSGEFWSEILGLNEDDAIKTALAMAAEGGRQVRRDATRHIAAMKTLVTSYIEIPARPGQVDWEFLAMRTMRTDAAWKVDDKARHQRALVALGKTGYVSAGGQESAAAGTKQHAAHRARSRPI